MSKVQRLGLAGVWID